MSEPSLKIDLRGPDGYAGGLRSVGFYVRVSTERQAKVEEGSLKNQEQMLRAELERRNDRERDWGSFVATYVDEGLSGKDTNRPAFQRLVRDIELGRINTVMFTELSRLSRSLKDFLSIFEFAQRHGCDLICLKTDIDTTSPYQGLVTKILMVFAEFEREMTSQRTSQNAYERGKRGLANGGRVLLGYRRDPKHKGHLLVDKPESSVVQSIFETYCRERSIRITADLIAERYEGNSERLRRFTPSKIHSVLTNKSYIGVRTIYKGSKTDNEEVEAAWEPIIDDALFEQAQELLQANKNRAHRHGNARHNYLFSGLLRCGKCGEKLQGRSAHSSDGTRHFYYAHKNRCTKNGHDRVAADTVETSVLDWLSDLANNSKRFEELEAETRRRLQRKEAVMKKELHRLDLEQSALQNDTEMRIRELTRINIEAVRDSIEESIIALETQKKKNGGKRFYLTHELAELSQRASHAGNLLKSTSNEIHRTLRSDPTERKAALRKLLSSLEIGETDIKVALSSVNHSGPCSTAFDRAPPVGLRANGIPSLIEDTIPLPGRLVLRSRSYLQRLYEKERLSARQIARQLRVSHSTVLAALASVGLSGDGHNGNGNGSGRNGQLKIKGQIPFGFVAAGHRLVKCNEEQQVIRLARQLRRNGLSLRKIAEELNLRLIPTKNNGIWQANTVKKILDRVAEKR